MSKIEEMEAVLAPLWRLSPARSNNILQQAAFAAFKDHCQSRYPNVDRSIGTPLALWHALCALGVPCGQRPGLPSVELRVGARGMVDALKMQRVTRRYIAPLDLAGDLPPLRFGNAEVGRFSVDELWDVFEVGTLQRLHPAPLDLQRLAQFQWLVVEETDEVPPRVGERYLPFLRRRVEADVGAIEPHAGKFPAPVLKAIFALLLAPWEEWHDRGEVDWRAFTIPWAHLVTGDVFARPKAVPPADTLTWEPWFSADGEEHERPATIYLEDAASAGLAHIGDAYWAKLEAARTTVLFETPVEHFVLRAYLSDGMDEIMAHMTAVEAAVGLRTDAKRKGMPARERVAQRIRTLLGDGTAGQTYLSLFETRSEFVHGRVIQGKVPSVTRNEARCMARRVAAALVERAVNLGQGETREDFLQGLA